ncbi:G-protein alpha subunit-domain-containing protein [Boletus edulis BED1]|uniref:G-protein alpha subunit-domain-containing protein n=1 Tax=Boletus edulis BED1 TaxID=1328754 RepID=A0AAD4C9U9_BOLED|nr:G-protein alpha subunit-domain-containing protein [Boletus edulis BED1]
MGAVASAQNEGRVRSNAIDREINESRNCQRVNMLLLGRSLMSMIVKQMKTQHGLTNDELVYQRLVIYQNCLDGAQALVRAIRRMGIEYTDPMNGVRADHILDYRIRHSPSFVFSPKVAEAIHHLWQDPILPKVMDRRREFWLRENAEYFFKEILRIGSPDYLPTDNDILRAQEDLTRVVETRLTFASALQVNIIDPRKQYSPRKWIHHVEDISYIIFCVSLGNYDQAPSEGNCQRQLNDSFIVFESVVNSRWFTRTSVMLFLTNIDVFKDKLSEVPLERHFPDYTGGTDVNEAIEYMQSRFMQVNRARLPTYFMFVSPSLLCSLHLHSPSRHQAMSTTIDSIHRIVKDTGPDHATKDSWRELSSGAAIRALRLCRMFPPTRSSKSRLWGIF